MFFVIKSSTLKMLRTLPTIWISYLNGVPHCWIPRTGYSYKIKNRAQPPNETDIEARKEWHFSECEILFNREFSRFNDGEMELSRLDYSSEWFYDYAKTSTANILSHESNQSNKVCQATEDVLPSNDSASTSTVVLTENISSDNSQMPSNDCVIQQDILLNELSNPSSQGTEDVLSSNNSESTSTEAELPVNQSDLGSTELNNSSSEPKIPPYILSDLEKYNENKRLCELHYFKPPIHYKKFEKLLWMYVRNFNANDLQPGYEFLTLEELSSRSRKYDKPFCRPGPEKRSELYDWYLADSIVQKVYLKSDTFPFFVVRWVGYEDEYNTVEPLANVKHTAIYTLFTSPNLYTACRSKNGCILRRSGRKVLQEVTVQLQMDINPTKYELGMNKLVYELRIEEEAGRYSPEIGFCSYRSVTDALMAQHRFFIDKFLLLIKELKSTVHLDHHYIGQICGNLCKAAEFKEILTWGLIKKSSSIKDFIHRGLSQNSKSSTDSPHYVSFFVPRKFGTSESKNKIQLDLHMCVFTVRSHGGVKDAIYYEPSPKYFAHGLPKVLDELKTPVLKSFTRKFGVASENDDCMFQCMRYIIGIATGEVLFAPDLSEPCRKIDRHMAERATKKENLKTKLCIFLFPMTFISNNCKYVRM